MKKLTVLFILLFAMFSVHGLYADAPAKRTVYGKVLDAEGNPIPGAMVVVEGKPALGGGDNRH